MNGAQGLKPNCPSLLPARWNRLAATATTCGTLKVARSTLYRVLSEAETTRTTSRLAELRNN